MDRLIQKRIIIITLVITFAAVVIITTVGFVAKNKKQNPKGWILQSYGNSVALYNNDEIEEIYPDIVLDTLPEEDVRQLNNGIAFTTKEEATQAIEDYDG